MSLVNYWYIDKSGIDSLLAQISSELVQEKHIKTTQKGRGTINASLNFGEIVKKLLNTDVGASGEVEAVREIEKVEIQPYESKIQQLTKYIEQNEMLLYSKEEIFSKFRDTATNFICGRIEFDTSLNVANWAEAANFLQQWGYIPLCSGGADTPSPYDYSDNYYKKMGATSSKIVMSMSTDKVQTSYLGSTSHLAVYFRANNGSNIPLGVLGHVFKLTPGLYQIKPYAVWIG